MDLRLRPLRMHWLVWGVLKIVSQNGGIEKTLLNPKLSGDFNFLSSLHHKPLNSYFNTEFLLNQCLPNIGFFLLYTVTRPKWLRYQSNWRWLKFWLSVLLALKRYWTLKGIYQHWLNITTLVTCILRCYPHARSDSDFMVYWFLLSEGFNWTLILTRI